MVHSPEEDRSHMHNVMHHIARVESLDNVGMNITVIFCMRPLNAENSLIIEVPVI